MAVLVASSQAAGGDTIAPTSPTSLRLIGSTETSVTVAWNAATDNVAVEGYRVHVGSGRVRTKATGHTESGLVCGTSYAVEVRAYDHARNSSAPARAVVATAPCLDSRPPATPQGLLQIARSSSTATLAWQPSQDDVAVAGYALSLGGLQLDTTTETSYVFIGLRCGATYSVAVRAYDVARNESASAPYYVTTAACGDVGAPTAPTGLLQLDRTGTSMSIAWSASVDNVGVASYVVFQDGARVAETSGLTYGLAGLTCGTSYAIGVEAVDAAGNRSARNGAVMSTATCIQPPGGGDVQPPTMPANVTVGSVTASAVTLSWSPSSDDRGVAGYDVFRDGVREQVVPATSYRFAGLACDKSYLLGVAAYDAAGNRSSIAVVAASTSACSDSSPPSPPGGVVLLSRTSTSVTVIWAASSDDFGVAGYGAYQVGTLVGSTAETTYTFTGLTCDASVTFGIDAFDAAGNRSSRTNVVFRTAACGDMQAPSTPTELAVSGQTATSLTLSWKASSDNVAVAGYDVFASGSKVATVAGTSATTANLTCNTSYTLGVEAFDASGNRSARASTASSTTACSSPNPSPSPPSGSGDLYVAPNGSDASQCTQSAPCGTFARAYLVAESGDTVEVAAGDYPEQSLPADPTKTSTAKVVFQPAAGASVSLGGFTAGDNKTGIGPMNFELRDLEIGGVVRVSWGTQNVILRNIDAGGFNLTSTRNVQVYGGDYGPLVDGISHIKACGEPGCFPAEDILIDGALFHDYTITDPEKHSECLMIWPGRRVTIRNSTFRNCTDFDVLVKPYNTGLVGSPADITFENNFFDVPMPGNTATASCNPNCPRGGNAIAITDGSEEAWSGAEIRYNSSLGGFRVDPAVSNVVVKANVADKSSNFSCQQNATFSYNVWSGTTCSSTDRTAPLSSVFLGASSSAFDLHLNPASPADGAGDPGDYPPDDIDGDSRPQGPVDAGADERS